MTLSVLSSAASCSDAAQVIGEDQSTLAATNAEPVEPPPSAAPAVAPDNCLDVADSDESAQLVNLGDLSLHAGTWRGRSLSDPGLPDFILQLEASGDSTLIYGDASAPEPPADADVGYLCDGLADCTLAAQQPVLGYPYRVGGILTDGATLQALYRQYQPWQTWCELQTAHFSQAIGGGSDTFCLYRCLAGLSGSAFGDECTTGEPPVAIDCGQFALCGGGFARAVCACFSGGCEANTGLLPIVLTLTDSGDPLLVQTLSGQINGIPVVLQREAPRASP